MSKDSQLKEQSSKKKQYNKPQIKPLGDIRDVTMGGSPGIGDSGNAGAEKPFI